MLPVRPRMFDPCSNKVVWGTRSVMGRTPMGEAKQPVRLTPRGLMELRENSWSKRLKGASLAAECLASPEHTEQALAVLAALLHRESSPVERQWVLRRW